jgi:hypothetical protein
MTTPQFRTKTGRLTAYSFACGYIEQRSTNHAEFRDNDLYTELYMEHSAYHVRQFDRRNPTRTPMMTLWEVFDTLSEARSLFNRQKGRLVKRDS